MPNRKLPKNLILMRGTERPDRTNYAEPDPIVIKGMPDPPRDLKPDGFREWNRVISWLVSNRIVGEEGLSAVATYCNVYARIVEMEKLGGCADAALLTQYRLLASELGLTPAGRARLKAGNGKKEDEESKRFFG